jgi:hypothetical protein
MHGWSNSVAPSCDARACFGAERSASPSRLVFFKEKSGEATVDGVKIRSFIYPTQQHQRPALSTTVLLSFPALLSRTMASSAATKIAEFLRTMESDDDDDELLRQTPFKSSRASLVSSSSSPPHGSQPEEDAVMEDAATEASGPVAVTQEEDEATTVHSSQALLHAQARRNVVPGGAPVEKVTETWQLGWEYVIKKQGSKTKHLQVFPCVLRPRQGPEAGALPQAPGPNEYVVQYLGLKGQYSTLTNAVAKSRYVPAYFPTRPKKIKAWREEDRSADQEVDQTQWSAVLMSLYLKQLRRLPAFKSDQADLLVLEEEIYLKNALEQVLKQETEAIEAARRQAERKEQEAAEAAAVAAEIDRENQEEGEKEEIGDPIENGASNTGTTSTGASAAVTAAAATAESATLHESVPDTAIVRQSCRLREKNTSQRKRPLADKQQSTRILQAGDEISYPYMGEYREGNIRIGRIVQVFSERTDADVVLKIDNGDFVPHGSLVKLERRWLRQKLVHQQASEFIGTEYYHLKTDRNGQFDHLHAERVDAVGAMLRETSQHIQEVGWRVSQELMEEGDEETDGDAGNDQGDDEVEEQRRAPKARRQRG